MEGLGITHRLGQCRWEPVPELDKPGMPGTQGIWNQQVQLV